MMSTLNVKGLSVKLFAVTFLKNLEPTEIFLSL